MFCFISAYRNNCVVLCCADNITKLNALQIEGVFFWAMEEQAMTRKVRRKLLSENSNIIDGSLIMSYLASLN